jgi:hypothetical protein
MRHDIDPKKPPMNEAIWDKRTGKQLGWVADGRDVFSCETEKKIATLRDGNLYSLKGEPLNISLGLLEGGDAQSGEQQSDAVARFKKLAG